jgi:hypothetical protein
VPQKQEQINMFLGAQQRNVRQTSSKTAGLAYCRLDSSGESVANRFEPKNGPKMFQNLESLTHDGERRNPGGGGQ